MEFTESSTVPEVMSDPAFDGWGRDSRTTRLTPPISWWLFESLGVAMRFDGGATPEAESEVAVGTMLAPEEIHALIAECCRR